MKAAPSAHWEIVVLNNTADRNIRKPLDYPVASVASEKYATGTGRDIAMRQGESNAKSLMGGGR
jgi:hypothetical protein